MWAFGTSPQGLALSSSSFWATSPRELEALIKVLKHSRDPLWGAYAGIQATLHNAWLRPKGKPEYKASDFLPREDVEMKPQGQTEEEKKAMLRLMLSGAAAQNRGART